MRTTLGSLQGGPQLVWRYGGSAGTLQATAAPDPLRARLLQVPRTFRAALAAARDA